MARLIKETSVVWSPVRPELTRGVEGKLLRDGLPRIVLTKVVSGGQFYPHRDTYGHLFQVLSGRARVQVEEELWDLGAGEEIRIAPGELHGYENLEAEDLLLISVNLPGEK